MRFTIEQGCFRIPDGWQPRDNGYLWVIVNVDENNKQIGEAECVVDLEDIPETIRKIKRRNNNENHN